MSWLKWLLRRLRSTSFRSFILYPLIVVAWELAWYRALRLDIVFVPLMLWGYLQYRFVGVYRTRHGGGGPGLDVPPERLVTSGPYAYTRNPMYLGHIIFLAGLSLTLKSWFALALLAATVIWFDLRVRRDERNMAKLFGRAYGEYTGRVRRWLPGLY